MGSEEDAALIRRGYEAFSAGDMNTLRELFAEDAVWHTGGTGPLSGDKKGRDAILESLGELASRSNGSFKITEVDVAVGEKRTVGFHRNQAERDGRSLDQHSAIAFTVSGGKIVDVVEMAEDTAKASEFWS